MISSRCIVSLMVFCKSHQMWSVSVIPAALVTCYLDCRQRGGRGWGLNPQDRDCELIILTSLRYRCTLIFITGSMRCLFFLFLNCHQHHPIGCFTWCDRKKEVVLLIGQWSFSPGTAYPCKVSLSSRTKHNSVNGTLVETQRDAVRNDNCYWATVGLREHYIIIGWLP